MDTQERRRRARHLLIQAVLWAPSMNERDIILEGMAELPDLDDSPRPGPSDADYVANSGDCAVLRDGASYPSEIPAAVRVTQHCGMRVIIISFFHSPLSLKTSLVRAAWHHPRKSVPTTGRHGRISATMLSDTLTNVLRDSELKCSGKKYVSGRPPEGGAEQREQHASQARKR